MNDDGDYIAPELAVKQTLENLEAFGDRLHKMHGKMNKDFCECREKV